MTFQSRNSGRKMSKTASRNSTSCEIVGHLNIQEKWIPFSNTWGHFACYNPLSNFKRILIYQTLKRSTIKKTVYTCLTQHFKMCLTMETLYYIVPSETSISDNMI